MTTLLLWLDWIIPGAYLALWIAHARAFMKPLETEPASSMLGRIVSKPPLYAMLGVHLLYMVLRGVAQQAWPLASKAEFFSLLAISIFSVWLFTQRDEEESQTGIFFLGITSTFQVLAAALMIPVSEATHTLLLESPIYGIHVVFMVLGFAALAVGALEAVMYIMLSRQLKARAMGLVFQKLPPLMRLEEMSRRATIAGIFLLGTGLLVGHVAALYVFEGVNPWDPKIVLTDLAWGAYFIGWLGVRLKGLSGLRMAYMSAIAFAVLMLTVALSNLLLSSFHSFQG